MTRTLSARNNGASMPHTPARRSSAAGDEGDDRLGVFPRLVVFLQVLRSILLHATTDLTDQNDA